MKRNSILEILIALFVLLFAYTAFAKLLHFAENVKAMHNQPLPTWLTSILIYALPISELIVVALLMIEKTRLLALYLFTGMMLAFTGYVALVLSNYYGRIPCSCGGMLKQLNWEAHLYLNSIFTGLGILGIYLTRKQDRHMYQLHQSAVLQ